MPRVTGNATGSGVQAVVLALHILEFIAKSPRSVGVTEVSRMFETSKSRIFRHLQTLVSAGYLVQDAETERYKISARLMALGQAVSEGYEFSAVAKPIMMALRDKLGHAVALSCPETDGVRIIAIVPGKSNVEVAVKPGSSLSFHGSAQGKLTLAYGDPTMLPRLLSSRLEAFTEHTLVQPNELRAEVARVHKQGWAIAANEVVIGLNALAAPIFDAMGKFAGSIALVDSIQFVSAEPTREQIDGVIAAARAISEQLGAQK